jgi:hypothetical protein
MDGKVTIYGGERGAEPKVLPFVIMTTMDEQTITEFVCKAENILRPYSDLAGSVLYSSKSTLKLNSIVFYGINPGYEQTANHKACWKIGDSLTEFADGFPDLASEPNKHVNPIPTTERLHRDCNLLDDQQWPYVGRGGELRYKWAIGQANYQNNTRSLLRLIPANFNVIVGNWFFLQSRTADGMKEELEKRGHNYATFLDDCWRLQRVLFELTKPCLLITCEDVLGRAGLRRKLKLRANGEPIFSGHRHHGNQTYCQHFRGCWLDESSNEHKIHVCKIPHSSWYNIVGKKYQDHLLVSDWFSNVVRSACGNSGNTEG